MIKLPESFSSSSQPRDLARSQVLKRTWPFVLDLASPAFGLACFYGVVQHRAATGSVTPCPQIAISLSPRALCRSMPSTPSSASASPIC